MLAELFILLYDNIIKSEKGDFMKRQDAVLHPVRMRIIQLLMREPRTAQEMIRELGSAQATVYRHLQILERAEVIRVEGEKQVRGALEKTYVLHAENASFQAADVADWSGEDFRRAFLMHTSHLLQLVGDYTEGEIDAAKDGFGFHQVELSLQEKDFKAFQQEYVQLLQKYEAKKDTAARGRTLAAVFIPEKSKGGSNHE